MATTPLTNEQIDDWRHSLSDTTENFILSATRLETLWQKAEGNEALMMAYCLRDMVLFYARKPTAEGQDERVWNDRLYEHYKALLDDAVKAAGLNLPALKAGKLILGQNYPLDDSPDSAYEWDV